MSLHDPEMECCCDAKGCSESVFLPMDWSTGGYDLTDEKAKRLLESEHAWVVIDGKHYCDYCVLRV